MWRNIPFTVFIICLIRVHPCVGWYSQYWCRSCGTHEKPLAYGNNPIGERAFAGQVPYKVVTATITDSCIFPNPNTAFNIGAFPCPNVPIEGTGVWVANQVEAMIDISKCKGRCTDAVKCKVVGKESTFEQYCYICF